MLDEFAVDGVISFPEVQLNDERTVGVRDGGSVSLIPYSCQHEVHAVRQSPVADESLLVFVNDLRQDWLEPRGENLGENLVGTVQQRDRSIVERIRGIPFFLDQYDAPTPIQAFDSYM